MSKVNKKLSLLALSLITLLAILMGALFMNPVQATVSVPTDAVIWMENTASVRLDYDDGDDQTDKTGIRFTVNVNKEMLADLTAEGEYEGYNATLGAAIIPTKYLGIEELDASKTSYTYNEQSKAVKHVELVNKKEVDVMDGTTKLFTQQIYNAVITDIPAVNYATELSAKGYIKLEKAGEDTVYIQAETIAQRSIAQVITAYLTDTSEDGPDAEEKAQLNALVEKGVLPKLASTLKDGYLADMSSELYEGVAKDIALQNFGTANLAESTYLEDGYAGVTDGVLKVVPTLGGTSYYAFKIKLPKAITNKVELKMYVEYNQGTGMGLAFGNPDTSTASDTDGDGYTLVKNGWENYVIVYG